jgi:hypothetical protein
MAIGGEALDGGLARTQHSFVVGSAGQDLVVEDVIGKS